MRTSILRAFLPTSGALAYTPGGERFRFVGRDPIYDVAGCSKSLSLDFRGERLNVSVTSVQAGDTVVLKRGDGLRDVVLTAKADGILLDAPIRARPEMLRTLRGQRIQLDVDFQPETYDRLSGVATVARVARLKLAAAGEKGDCELTFIE
jgi:hypothetical protein